MSVALLCGAVGLARAEHPATADAALNAAYNELAAGLDPASAHQLRDAQRAWLAFRDKECAFRARDSDGGSPSPSVSSACVAELGGQRAHALQRQLDCPEGDVACKPHTSGGAAPPTANVDCSATAGRAQARRFVEQCQAVSPATHPPCHVVNPCELITGEIARGCGLLGKDAPAFCADYANGEAR